MKIAVNASQPGICPHCKRKIEEPVRAYYHELWDSPAIVTSTGEVIVDTVGEGTFVGDPYAWVGCPHCDALVPLWDGYRTMEDLPESQQAKAGPAMFRIEDGGPG